MNLPASFAAIVVAAGLAAAPVVASAATETRQIVQQRAADGRIVLTDRPNANATTERSWRFETEDPAAARQRAQDMKAEARAVSERVQRTIERQQAFELEQMRLARAEVERDRERLRVDDDVYGGGVLIVPRSYWGGPRGGHGRGRHDGRRPRGNFGRY